MKFKTEFPDYPVDAFPALPDDTFADTSWHNDTCPSMVSDKLRVTILIDYPDPKDREYGGKRFLVQEQNFGIETGKELLGTDDWNEVLLFLEKRRLGLEYTELVGYDPFEDDPKISVEEVRELLESVKEDAAAESEKMRIYYLVDTIDGTNFFLWSKDMGSMILQFRECITSGHGEDIALRYALVPKDYNGEFIPGRER